MSSNDDIFPPEHYEAIGRLIVACSRLDAIMTDLICLFAGLNILNGLILIHHQQFSSKYDCLMAMLRHSWDDHEGYEHPLYDDLAKAKAVHDYRSGLVHSMWGKSDDGSPMSVRFSARGRFKSSRAERPTTEILSKAQEGDALADELAGLRDHLLSKEAEGAYPPTR